MFNNWTKEDSQNLASIAKSLEKLAEREAERKLIEDAGIDTPFLTRMKESITKKVVKVTDSKLQNNEDQFLEDEMKATQRMSTKFNEARKAGNMPFFAEALLDEDELERL